MATTVSAHVFHYSVKFVCGVQAECDCQCVSVQPGRYSTEINIHNSGATGLDLQFRFLPLVLAGAPAGREPKTVVAKVVEKLTLPPLSATMIDCCRISQLLLNGESQGAAPLHIGFVEIVAAGELSVTAVYTTSGFKPDGVSIQVQQIAGRRQ